MQQGISRLLLALAIAGGVGMASSARVEGKVPPEWNPAALAVDLRLGTPEQQAQAIEKIKQWLSVDPKDGGLQLRRHWAKPLLDAGHQREVVDWCLQGLLGSLEDIQQLEDLSQIRVQALMALGKYEEAAQAAKSYFNVARSKPTAQALSLLAKCLEKANPSVPDIYERFKKEQAAGAVTDGTAPHSGFMDSIKSDRDSYEKALREYARLEQDDNQTMLAYGNLLFLADRGDEALKFFQGLEGLSPKARTECIARAMKARDGVIGNANAYLLSANHGDTP